MKFKRFSAMKNPQKDSVASEFVSESKEHKAYLAKLKKDKILVKTLQVAILFALIFLWEFGARRGFIDDFIMSSPSRMWKTAKELFYGELWTHVGVTLFETILGFVISSAMGFLIAFSLWYSEMAHRVFSPYLIVLNALPKVALGPVIIIWVGVGTSAIIAMVILICVVVTTLNILHGLCDVDRDMIFLLQSMGAKRLTIFSKLVLPSASPLIVSTLKINVGLAFVGAIMGEYLVSRAGLGYLIVYGGQVFNLDLVMTSTVILLILAGGMYGLVALLEKRLLSRR